MNKDSAIAQANLNRINQITPQGTLSYRQIGTNADGTPQYEQTMAYSADEQAKYDQGNKVALALGDLAGSNISRVQEAQAKPFTYDGMTEMKSSLGLSGIGDAGPIQRSLDYSKLTALPGTDDFGAEQARMAATVYGQAASRLDPRFEQSDSDMRSRLAAQGISENSDAYRRELDNASRAKNDAYNQAMFSAIQAGSDEQSRLFGLALGARQQGQNEVDTQGTFANTAQGQAFGQEAQRTAVANANRAAEAAYAQQKRQQEIEEAAYARNLPLNDIAALLGTGGGVSDPNFNPVSQVGVAAPDYMGAVNNNYNAKMQQYNQAQANRSAGLGSIFGAAGSIGSAMILSDKRFKENIVRVGTLANGLATYAYNYIGDKAKQFGVMAQEALDIVPDAVGTLPNGVMYVDYRKVY